MLIKIIVIPESLLTWLLYRAIGLLIDVIKKSTIWEFIVDGMHNIKTGTDNTLTSLSNETALMITCLLHIDIE